MVAGPTRTVTRTPKARWGRAAGAILLAGIAGAGLFVWWSQVADLYPGPVEFVPTVGNRSSGSIILAAPNRDGCRRYRLDNASGKLTDEGVGDCAGDADAAGSSNRFRAIAKGFRTGR